MGPSKEKIMEPNNADAIKASVKKHSVLIFAGFSIIVGILFSMGVVGLRSLSEVTANLSQVVEVNHAKARLMTTMRDVIRERMIKVHTILNLDDPFVIEEQWEQYSAYASTFIKTREELLALGLTPRQQEQIEEQRELLLDSGTLLNRVIELAKQGENWEVDSLILEAQQANQKVLDELSEMRDYQQSLSLASVHNATRNYLEARRDIFLLFGGAVLTCALIVLFIMRRIRCQAEALTDALGQVEEMNRTLEVRVEQRTEELMAARAENMRMGAELQVSQRLQQMMLPREEELRKFSDLDISGIMFAADEVGGDYYDVLRAPDKLIFSVGDVTGHGLESGVLMLIAQTAMRALSKAGVSFPAVSLEIINQTLFESARRMRSDKSMTLNLLCYDEGRLEICGQHEEVLIVRANGEIEAVDTTDLGFPLGIEADITALVDIRDTYLEVGDGVVLYTDGITEAFDTRRRQYGLPRLCKVVSRHWHKSARQIQTMILEDLQRHMLQQADDVTVLIVKRIA